VVRGPLFDFLAEDHVRLAALLVPTPTPAILAKIYAILETHNLIEEGPGGVYEVCEQLAGDEAEALLAEMRAMPEIKLAPHVDGPQVVEQPGAPSTAQVTASNKIAKLSRKLELGIFKFNLPS
jgi:hypothetical protein